MLSREMDIIAEKIVAACAPEALDYCLLDLLNPDIEDGELPRKIREIRRKTTESNSLLGELFNKSLISAHLS